MNPQRGPCFDTEPFEALAAVVSSTAIKSIAFSGGQYPLAFASRIVISTNLNVKGYGTGTETIDQLCSYFGCTVQDLMEHVEDRE